MGTKFESLDMCVTAIVWLSLVWPGVARKQIESSPIIIGHKSFAKWV